MSIAERRPGLPTRVLDRIGVPRERRVRISSSFVACLSGMAVFLSAAWDINTGIELNPTVRKLEEQWVRSLSPEDIQELRGIESIVARQMKANYINKHGDNALARREDAFERGFPSLLLGEGVAFSGLAATILFLRKSRQNLKR